MNSGFRELEISGNGWDGRPADTGAVGPGVKIEVEGNGVVGQVQAVEGC